MDGTCRAAGKVVGEGSFQGGEGTRAVAGGREDLAKVGYSAEVDSGSFFRKLCVVGSEERMWKPSLKMCFEFREARIR